MLFLKSHGYSELEFAGVGMIMSDVAIEFKTELFYGDIVIASVAPAELSKIGFDLLYRLEKQTGNTTVLVAVAKTCMICYNYQAKKIVALPQEARVKLQ